MTPRGNAAIRVISVGCKKCYIDSVPRIEHFSSEIARGVRVSAMYQVSILHFPLLVCNTARRCCDTVR